MKILFILIPLFSFSQISKEVRKLSIPLDTITFAEGAKLGYAGKHESKIYKHFLKIEKRASNNELMHFAKNGSNALRFYSTQALIHRKDHRIINLYRFYFFNELIISYNYYDVISSIGISEHIKNELNRISKNIESYKNWNIEEVENIIMKIGKTEKDWKNNYLDQFE